MRILALMVAAVALSAEAPPPELREFDAALTSSQHKDAAAVLNKLIERRTPQDGQPRPDSLLNSLLGRLFLGGHEPAAAAAYLAHAQLGELPPSARASTALAYGKALEMQGDSTGALQAYRNAATAGGTDSERRQATLGIARQLLASDPSAVREQLLGIATGAPASDRWEARYLLSLANSLLGDRAAATRLADEAWLDAASAPARDLAPLHVATLKAGLAAARGDVAAERAMLTATNGLSVSAASPLSAQLPVCGDDGVAPADFVIFGIVAGPYGTRDLVPIAASRMGAVAPFHTRLAGFTLLKEATGKVPLGTVVTVSCRSSVAGSYVARPMGNDPLLDWFVARGLYPARATNENDDPNLNAVAARVDSLQARFGKQSSLLIAPKWQLMNLLELRARAGDQVLPGQLSDLRNDIAEGLRRAGAPPWLAPAVDWQGKYREIEQTSTGPADAMKRMEAFYREQLVNTPFDLARTFIIEMLGNINNDEFRAPAARLVLAVNSRAPKTLNGRERQAWHLTVADAQRELGMEHEAQTTLASAGLERDLCAAADSRPRLLEQHFTYEDYPDELILGEQEGAVLFDFNLAPAGFVASPHILYSLPSGLFDRPSAKGIATIRYTPAVRGGKPAACRGIIQPVIWRLEDDKDFWVPSLTPQPPDETT